MPSPRSDGAAVSPTGNAPTGPKDGQNPRSDAAGAERTSSGWSETPTKAPAERDSATPAAETVSGTPAKTGPGDLAPGGSETSGGQTVAAGPSKTAKPIVTPRVAVIAVGAGLVASGAAYVAVALSDDSATITRSPSTP